MSPLTAKQAANRDALRRSRERKRLNRADRLPPTAEELEKQRKEEERIREEQIGKLGELLSRPTPRDPHGRIPRW